MSGIRFGGFLTGLVGLLVVSTACASEPSSQKSPPKVRIGTFDSRAIAMAHFGKQIEEGWLKKLYEEHAEAISAKDTKRAEELAARGQGRQRQLHRQIFGTGSAKGALKNVQKSLPVIASSAGVEMIVCVHEVAFCGPSVELVDVTDTIVELFNPDKETREKIKAVLKHPPFPDEVVERIDLER